MTKTRWIGSILLYAGIAIVALSSGLGGLAYCVKRAADNTEWGTIRTTGHSAHPEALHWSDWQAGRRDLHPFMGYSGFGDKPYPGVISEYRVGRGANWLMDFVCYEGREVVNGVTREFPVEGPDWGVHVHWRWVLLGLALGMLCLALSLWVRTRTHISDQGWLCTLNRPVLRKFSCTM